MIRINLKESTSLSFDIAIEGSIRNVDSAHFLIEGDGFYIKIPCVYEDTKVNCNVPILENIIGYGNKNVALELVIDGRVYTPFNDTVEFERPVEIKSNLSNSLSESKPIISVKSITPNVSKLDEHIMTNIKSMVVESITEINKNQLTTNVKNISKIVNSLKEMPNSQQLVKKWAAMNEDMGIDLKDVNSNLEVRKVLLNLRQLIS